MRNLTVLAAAAGATILFTGCVDDVMKDRHYIPAPTDNVPVMGNNAGNVENPEISPVAQPATPVAKPKYEPMTDVKSSEGVDSADGFSAPSGKSVSASGKVYIVKRGDFPGRIAARHGVRLADLMKLNNLDAASARKLRVGQKLLIPEKSTAIRKSVRVRNSSNSGKKAVTSAVDAGKLENGKYTVKSGDTPERIARRFKVKLNDLLSANNLNESSARRLQIGQKLVIPGKEVTSGEVVTPPVPVTPPTAELEQKDNTVIPEKTDVPVDSATNAGTTTAATDAAIQNPAETDAGGVDAIEVTQEMTLAEFAAKHNTSEAKIRELNTGVDLDKLTPGTLICIPKK